MKKEVLLVPQEIRHTSTRLRDILRVLSSGEELTIKEIWQLSKSPPRYDVAVRQGLTTLWGRKLVERHPHEIRRGRAQVTWVITDEGRETQNAIVEGEIDVASRNGHRPEDRTK